MQQRELGNTGLMFKAIGLGAIAAVHPASATACERWT